MAPRLREQYEGEVVPALMQEFQYSSPMQVPRLQKAVLNIGLGEALQNNKALDAAVADLAAIAGQKPVVTKAKKSIAAFKLREGQSIGAMVTLRGVRMYDFLDRLVNLALPRLRDFRGSTLYVTDSAGVLYSVYDGGTNAGDGERVIAQRIFDPLSTHHFL
jgi:large subunit ribosomal protein L5